MIKSVKTCDALRPKEFSDLLQYINKHHNFRDVKGKMIKYIRPSIDMRDNKIFHIMFDGMFKEGVKEFNWRDGNLEEMIYSWLKSDDVKTDVTAEGLKLGDMNIEFGKKE